MVLAHLAFLPQYASLNLCFAKGEVDKCMHDVLIRKGCCCMQYMDSFDQYK